MPVGNTNSIGKNIKATSERSMFIEYLDNAKFDIVIEVMDFSSQEKKQMCSNGKVSFERSKVESK